MEKIINLINGKIRTDNKINQITDNILNNESVVLEKKKKNKKQKHWNDEKGSTNHFGFIQ